MDGGQLSWILKTHHLDVLLIFFGLDVAPLLAPLLDVAPLLAPLLANNPVVRYQIY